MTKRLRSSLVEQCLLIRLPGRLRAEVEDALVPEVVKGLKAPIRSIILDFSRVDASDSAGVGLLVEVIRRAMEKKVPVVLCALQGQPEIIVERLGITDYARRTNSVEEALAQSREPSGE